MTLRNSIDAFASEILLHSTWLKGWFTGKPPAKYSNDRSPYLTVAAKTLTTVELSKYHGSVYSRFDSCKLYNHKQSCVGIAYLTAGLPETRRTCSGTIGCTHKVGTQP